MITRVLGALTAVMSVLGKLHPSAGALLAGAAVVLGGAVLTWLCVLALQALDGYRPGSRHRLTWSTS